MNRKQKNSLRGYYSLLFDLSGGRMDNRGSYLLGLARLLKAGLMPRNPNFDEKIFCQNIGGTGSHNIVKLFQINGFSSSFHEMSPDLEQLGLSYYLGEISSKWIERTLRTTRKDVNFEANNRLFSMSREISNVFPNAKFIFLHRNGHDAVRSMMRKNVDPSVRKRNKAARRFNCGLNGPASEKDPFRKACYYWANMNNRIANDLEDISHIHLKFEDLINGRLNHVEDFLNLRLKIKTIDKSTSYGKKIENEYPGYSQWNEHNRHSFDEICGPVMKRLGYI